MHRSSLNTSLLWASTAVSIAGFIFYNIMPVYLGQLQDSSKLSIGQTGLVASAFFFGFNIVSFSSLFWVRRVPLRQTSLGIALALIAILLFSSYSYSFIFQMLLSAIIGGLSGAAGSICVTIAGDAENTTRWYGIQIAAAAVAGVLLLFVLPVTLVPRYGFTGVVLGTVFVIAISLPGYYYLTRGPLPPSRPNQLLSGATSLHAKRSTVPVWAALIAMALMYVSVAAVWAFAERIAAINEFDREAVSRLLGISLVFSVLGSAAVGVVGDRFGNIWPYILNCLLILLGFMMLALTRTLSVYATGACIFMFGWAAAFAFLFAIIAEADPDGKHIALSIPAVGVGSMIGPGVAGFLLSEGSTANLQVMCVSTLAASMILAWISRYKRTAA